MLISTFNNFILIQKDEGFQNTNFNRLGGYLGGLWVDIVDIIRHGYACSWFTNTIDNNTEIGFNWDLYRKEYKSILNHQGWDGVINGSAGVIEGLSNYKTHETWNYTKPWYTLDSPKPSDKPSE